MRKVSTPEDYINLSLYFEAKTFLHGLLIVEDKLSMAHGLETRVPFLDNDIVDFAMACPVSMKLNNLADVIRLDENDTGNKVNKYYQKTSDGKKILREMMLELVPSEIIESPKQGFSAPDKSWFKGESIRFVEEKIWNRNNRIYEFLDFQSVNSMVQEHLDGKKNRRLLIWSLLYLEQWFKTNL